LKNKKTALIIGILLVLVIGAAAFALSNDDISAKLGLRASAASPKTELGESGAGSTSGGAKSTSPGGGSQGSGSGSASGSGSSASNPPILSPKGSSIKVKVMWWDDTSAKKPSSPEVVFGDSVYKPAAGATDQGVIGPAPVGKKLQLVIYPDGRSGAKIVADFLLTEYMKANSERDAIRIEVKDDGVRILGNPVVNFTQWYKR
jgi:hypothetical protein